MAETTTKKRGSRKVRKGVVVSKSGEKSVIVQSERRERHPIYGKVIRRFKKFHALTRPTPRRWATWVTIAETVR